MEKKIIQRDGKLIFKDWCDHHIYSTVDVLYYLSNSIGIDCVYDVQNTVTLKRNYFSKNYQINVANYAYPESKKNITNDIKYCNSILNEFNVQFSTADGVKIADIVVNHTEKLFSISLNVEALKYSSTLERIANFVGVNSVFLRNDNVTVTNCYGYKITVKHEKFN